MIKSKRFKVQTKISYPHRAAIVCSPSPSQICKTSDFPARFPTVGHLEFFGRNGLRVLYSTRPMSTRPSTWWRHLEWRKASSISYPSAIFWFQEYRSNDLNKASGFHSLQYKNVKWRKGRGADLASRKESEVSPRFFWRFIWVRNVDVLRNCKVSKISVHKNTLYGLLLI